MVSIDEIIQRAQGYIPELNVERVARAYRFAEAAHAGQTRFSGEPYIIHPLGVTSLLLDFHPDEDLIIAALLHDVAEDTTKTLEDIEAAFGPEVSKLCWGVQKLSKVRSKLNDPHVENLRKLFLAMAKDFRVVVLKLCDRLHNMSTLEFVRPEKRTRIAQETINIYAPIASRLGIYRLKSQLEDLCFVNLHPDEYKAIKEQLGQTEKWREQYIETAKKIFIDIFSQEGIQAQVDGRVKSSYSIFRKMKKKNKNTIDEVFDVFAMRVTLPDIFKHGKEYTGHLYTALGIIHKNFTPLANRFKDYVAVPKVNGYRSLHTTVMGLGPKIHTQPTEIQIRSESMHQSAEFGIAAHWLYKEGKKVLAAISPKNLKNIDEPPDTLEAALVINSQQLFAQQKEWISSLGKMQKEITNNQELLEHLQVDAFQDRIFVLTPRGDVKDLPAGATPIDFAYSVHTDIGNRCIGAKVNGSIVPLDHELKSGEVVDVITRANSHPSQQWLSFVKTNHARNRIRNWFRNLDDDKHLIAGRQLINEKLTQLGRPTLDDTLSQLRQYGGKHLSLKQRQDILVEVGKGALFAGTVMKKIFTLDELLSGTDRVHRSPKTDEKNAATAAAAKVPENLFIGGEPNVPYQFVKCCSPTPQDELMGYVTRGRGISVHKKTCAVIRNIESSRLVPVSYRDNVPHYLVTIKIEAEERAIWKDIFHLITETGVDIINIQRALAKKTGNMLSLILEIQNFDQLEGVLSKLEKIPSIRRACKVN